eukprot:366401-Chlamydomonas_euryale.AAC.3
MEHHALHLRVISVPSNVKLCSLAWMARWMSSTCCATTDSTSRLMRLNSSKQAHAPLDARPLKNCMASTIPTAGLGGGRSRQGGARQRRGSKKGEGEWNKLHRCRTAVHRGLASPA